MADEATPGEVVDVGAATGAAPASPGPWQSDIEQSFADPQVRATVDQFLRSRIQPRMTQLEQQASIAENAQKLWDAFSSDPAGAYREITTELYGEEAGKAALEALEQRLNAANEQAPAGESEQQPPAPAGDPRMDEMYEWFRNQRARDQQAEEMAVYEASLDEVLSDPANADIQRERFHSFVAATEGDFDQAIAMYREDAARARAEVLTSLGLTPEQVAEMTAKNNNAPAVMGSEVAGNGAPPPTSPQYQGQEGLDRAIEDAVASMHRNAEAPPVS